MLKILSKLPGDAPLPNAKMNLEGFSGAVLHVDVLGALSSRNEAGKALLDGFSEQAAGELTTAASRAAAAGAVRMERLKGPFPGEWVEAVIVPLEDADGVLIMIVTNVAEVALRRALIESRHRYRDLVEVLTDFVWESDRHGRFIFLSSHGALGYTARDLLGRRCEDLVVDTSLAAVSIFQAHEPVVDADVWMQSADGEIRCQLVSAVPMYDQQGAWCGVRGTARDVTELRERERSEKQQALRDRLVNYLGRTIRGGDNPERSLAVALSGIGLAVGAVGGVLIGGDPEQPEVDIFDWGESLEPAEYRNLFGLLDRHGEVDVLRDGRRVLGYVTGRDGKGQVAGAIFLWNQGEASGFGDADRSVMMGAVEPLHDALERLRKERQSLRDASLDPATQLDGHSRALSSIERRLRGLRLFSGFGVLACIEIDRTLAYSSRPHTDRSMRMIAEALRRELGAFDIAGRLSDDSLVLWLEIGTPAETGRRIDACVRSCRGAIETIAEAERPSGLSVGVLIVDGTTHQSTEDLLARTAEAAESARTRSRSGYVLVDLTAPGGVKPAGADIHG